MKISCAWLQTYFGDELPSADKLAELLTFHSFEVEGVMRVGDDWLIDLDILPNRSSDCLSHRGVARELATLLERPMRREPLREPVPSIPTGAHLTVAVDDHMQCSRYMGAIIRGVTVGESPAWLRQALETVGLRSINNVVDITNYVMLDIGQPLHVFDLAKLGRARDGTAALRVRAARQGERITVLTGETYELSEEHLLITDGVRNSPLALAGIKGAMQAQISTDTVDLVLEAAHFNYKTIRSTSRTLKLSTDASLRFQNNPAVELPAFAVRDAVRLIADIAGGTLVEVADAYQPRGERTPIDVTLSRINTVLGTTLSIEDVERILVRFEWEFSRDREEFAVTPPWERSDISIPEDIVEEVGRIYGLRTLQASLPKVPAEPPRVAKSHYYTDLIRNVCAELGYSEVLTYMLRDRGEVELANPLASDKAFVRMNLRDGLDEALTLNVPNAPLLGLDDVRLFEIGTRCTTRGEELSLALGVRAVRGKQAVLNTALMRDIAEIEARLGASLGLMVHDGMAEGSLLPALAQLERPKAYHEPLPWNSDMRFTAWSPYPYVLRDIAVWVPANATADEVLSVVQGQAGVLLVRHDQFDEYIKDDRVSYAWHLVFQADDHTLTDEEVTARMDAIARAIQTHKGWQVR